MVESFPLEDVLTSIRSVLWSPSATPDDKIRWHSQSFSFAESPVFGLQQGHGGPCGVLAAVEAEILRLLLFETADQTDDAEVSVQSPKRLKDDGLPNPTASTMELYLRDAMLNILNRVRGGNPIRVVMCDESPFRLEEQMGLPATPSSSFQVVEFEEVDDEAQALLSSVLPQFEKPTGVLLFVLSLVLTRSVEAVKEDMDDPTSSLIGQFGHCSQELVNLLLCGHAHSNVFDGSMAMEAGLNLRGIPQRCEIGYLTHLEALRYCQVGSYYKNPRYPVWVIGSQSHFTVLFSLSRDPVTESRSEMLLTLAQRAFKSLDPEENGFIPTDKFGALVDQLQSEFDTPLGASGVSTLSANLETAGAGIILWDACWRSLSRLMSGASLNSVLNTPAGTQAMTQPTRERSDSEVARELQSQLDRGEEISPSVPSSTEDPDLVYARQLQAQFDGVQSTPPAAPATTHPKTDLELAQELQAQLDETSGISQTQAAMEDTPTQPEPIHRHDSFVKEESGATFTLFHYNGLSSGQSQPRLVEFKLTRRSDQDIIGVAVPLGTSGGLGGELDSRFPIEDVLRTRWPGAKIAWQGTPPSID